jgi:hypothetical protein
MSTIQEENRHVTWAENELRRAGLFDKDSDYDGMMGDAVMDLVRTFSGAGHSGFSAGMTASIFGRLSQWKPLTPLTDDPDEWMHIDAEMAGDATTWQSRRQSSCFSNDAGKTYYDIDERQARWRRAAERISRRLHTYRAWQFTKRHRTDARPI